ncbi:hypothetical protein [Pseudochrobactrum sp. HB0163]|uniref:hypothetical protein n=1 Tax=Pseudochrobactrum sp. HB0163 TaxID=3450708 RepID=UPI003F6DAF17
MAKHSSLMRQLFRPGTTAKHKLKCAKEDNCPKTTSLMLILLLGVLAIVFLVKALG